MAKKPDPHASSLAKRQSCSFTLHTVQPSGIFSISSFSSYPERKSPAEIVFPGLERMGEIAHQAIVPIHGPMSVFLDERLNFLAPFFQGFIEFRDENHDSKEKDF
jgi:hypothetical protein